MLIFIVGFMGCGKSLMGRELAKEMKYEFIDTDEFIETKRKKSITKIFATEGEEFFRQIEKKTLTSLIKERNAVISAGGGMPCYFDNMQLMNSSGITVYIEAGAGFLFHRLMREKKDRPLISNLSDIELMEYISGTLNTRKHFYEQATITVNAEKITAIKLKEKIHRIKSKS